MFIQQAFGFNEVTCIRTTQQCLPAQKYCQSLALCLPADFELDADCCLRQQLCC